MRACFSLQRPVNLMESLLAPTATNIGHTFLVRCGCSLARRRRRRRGRRWRRLWQRRWQLGQRRRCSQPWRCGVVDPSAGIIAGIQDKRASRGRCCGRCMECQFALANSADAPLSFYACAGCADGRNAAAYQPHALGASDEREAGISEEASRRGSGV